MRIKLSDADRERFGCPEWLEFKLDRLAAIEAGTVQARTGLNPESLFRELRPTVLVDNPDGSITAWSPTDDNPEPPDGAQVRFNYDAWVAVVWVALRRAGSGTSWENAAEFDVFNFVTEPSESEVPSEGKGSSTLPTTSTV